MLVIVVGVFLLVEMPLAVFIVVMIAQHTPRLPSQSLGVEVVLAWRQCRHCKTGEDGVAIVKYSSTRLPSQPQGVRIVMIAENTFGATVLTPESRDLASLYLNLFTLVSYPVNFFIYCAMSDQFRRTFCGLFTCSSRPTSATTDNIDDPGDVQMSPFGHVEMLSAAEPPGKYDGLISVEMVSVVDVNRPDVVVHQINGPQFTN